MKPPPEPMPTTPQKQKRPLLDACIIDYRPSKNGKRVRFEDDPVYVEAAPVCESASKVICEKRLSPSPWVPMVVSDDKVPERRWGATFTRVSSNSVVLLGGESESAGFFKDMCMLDIADNKWLSNGKDTPDMLGCGRAWHTTVSVDGANLFVFGGEMEVNGERTQTNSAVMYDTSYYTWYPPALSGPAPSARAGHCAAVVPGTKNVVIFGGINGNRWLSDVHLLEELNCWSKVRVSNKSVRPSARSYASLTPTTEYLVLFGGNNKTKCFNDVHIMLPDLTWTEPIILGRAPKARTGHSAITSKDGNNVIVYGGWDDQGAQRIFYSDIWMLRIKSQSECQWTCLFQGDNSSRAPGPRAGASFCAAAAQDEHILLFGGWHQLSYFNDISKLVLPSCSKKGAQPP